MAAAAAGKASTLYRSLLRAHKQHLPAQMKELGNAYVKSEFKLHRTAKPEQVERFYKEWDGYLQQILQTARAHDVARSGMDALVAVSYGKDLPPDLELTGEQLEQLGRLKEETTKSSNPT
jgi:hypothetical protein